MSAAPFSAAGGLAAANVARWNLGVWLALGSGVGGTVNSLAVFADRGDGLEIHAAGSFTTAGGAPASRLAKWNGASWLILGPGADGTVTTLIPATAGGARRFSPAAFSSRPACGWPTAAAFWRDGVWSPATSDAGGQGLDGNIDALAVHDAGAGPALFAIGSFRLPGWPEVAQVGAAKWNGAAWSLVGSAGLSAFKEALLSFDDGDGPALYAAGWQTSMATGTTGWVVRLDGGNWTSIGTGPPAKPPIYALAGYDDGNGPALYAGGHFTSIPGGTSFASSIAKWDGAGWQALGPGVFGAVRALAVFDDGGGSALYAAGDVENIGGPSGTPVGRIARWNGSTWSALGAGLDGTVTALAVWNDGGGSALYAAGDFATAGGQPASRTAKWNGSTWSALGSGLDGEVKELAVFDDGAGSALYATGAFTTAGGRPAAGAARWDGAAWTPVGTGGGPVAASLAVFDSGAGPALYFGGKVLQTGGFASVGLGQFCRPGVFADGFERLHRRLERDLALSGLLRPIFVHGEIRCPSFPACCRAFRPPSPCWRFWPRRRPPNFRPAPPAAPGSAATTYRAWRKMAPRSIWTWSTPAPFSTTAAAAVRLSSSAAASTPPTTWRSTGPPSGMANPGRRCPAVLRHRAWSMR